MERAALGRLLAAHSAAGRGAGAPAALRAALSGQSPAEGARRLQYLSYLARAVSARLAAHRDAVAESASLREALAARAAELARIEAERRNDRERLLAERRERRRVLERIQRETKRARREINVLAADETRLARIVEEIGRVLLERPGAGYARAALPSPGESTSGFSRLKGSLRLPVRGVPERRPRAQKGIFIRAAEGETVRAVAAGRVVYAEWMRGFGNVLIVDHGEDYLTVYGNNESLLRQPGDPVTAGDPLATVGASGGNEQTGLYFELRHLGKALDPLGWAKLK